MDSNARRKALVLSRCLVSMQLSAHTEQCPVFHVQVTERIQTSWLAMCARLTCACDDIWRHHLRSHRPSHMLRASARRAASNSSKPTLHYHHYSFSSISRSIVAEKRPCSIVLTTMTPTSIPPQVQIARKTVCQPNLLGRHTKPTTREKDSWPSYHDPATKDLHIKTKIQNNQRALSVSTARFPHCSTFAPPVMPRCVGCPDPMHVRSPCVPKIR